ncbi:MAG: riboflavin biosynthesis protein RibF [Bacteroidetes bacterium]|nr:MAG: riboflavin biosynthesis protein RibF [Bacteroidota bacterium]
MKVHHLDKGFDVEKPIVLTIGTFDGVHAGHRAVISVLAEKARQIGGETALLTFDPHPRIVLHPENHGLKLLNTFEEKKDLLENAGLDNLIIANFDIELARLTPLEYVRGLLAEKIKPEELVIGDDHRFGRNREGSFDDLHEMGIMFGFGVTALDTQCVSEVRVSSTKVRNAIWEGNVKLAGRLLTRYFPLSGLVVKGDQIGRTIGFPTANLELNDTLKIIPGNGAYAVWARIEKGEWVSAMLNIGERPTLNSTTRTIELHLINWNGDCYGENIEVRFIEKLRNEIKFSNVNELSAALKVDRVNTLSILEKYNLPLL